MEKQKQMETDWVVSSNREYRYKEIRELIGKLTLIEKYIRIRLCNGTLHKDEDALHILLDLHKDAVYEIGMNLNSLKILDSEEEEECVEDDDEDDDEDVEDTVNYCVCKQIHDEDILRELYIDWLNYCDVRSVENAMFLHCGKFYITFERDIDNLESTHIFVPHYIFDNNQYEYIHYACFDKKNFRRLTKRIKDNDTIGYYIINLDNNTIATRLNYD